jgi:O-methyltransferase
MPISRDEVVSVYRELLGRTPESENVIRYHLLNNNDVFSMIGEAIKSEEFAQRICGDVTNLRSTEVNNRVYERIAPNASYAPWRSDAEFLNAYGMISDNTLVDLYRCWNLWHLVGQVAKHADPLDHFVEIGVWRGGTGVLMARAMAIHGLRQPIFLCDTFQGVAKAGVNDPNYHGGEHSDTSVEIVAALAESLGLRSGSYEIFVGVFPEDMPRNLRAGKFAYVHIDVDAYQSAKECFAEIWPRMTAGGVVVFDDYGFVTTSGVAKLVDELMRVPDGVCMYNLTGQAVFLKLSSTA